MENSNQLPDSYGVIARNYMLLPEQAEWLKRKALNTQRTASSVLRDLLNRMMQEDSEQAVRASSAN